MKTFRVFVTRKIPGQGIAMLKQRGYDVEVWSGNKSPSQKDIMQKATGADALLCLLTDKIDGEVMDAIGPQLKVISNYAVGLDNIALDEAKKRNIIVGNTPDVLTEAVAGHAVALILAIARRIVEADAFTRAGKYKGWEPELFLGAELQEKTLGILGCGRIGFEVAKKMFLAFGMRILYYDKNPRAEVEKACNAKYASIEELLQQSDVVSIHVPLLPETRHLIGEQQLKMMKPTSYLINTARGPVVNEKALLTALEQKWIAGAALDVFENEPAITSGLRRISNVVLTPHIASATFEARSKMSELAAKNIIDVLLGK
ncbi:MAG: D-glycerate dehydrogenase [Candidatus Wildermuthbacteria bacterium]|nr:D-glycerate dehydrogenase [Candidatus Wildermuthbacteria bacterium]